MKENGILVTDLFFGTSFFHYFDFNAAVVHNQIDILNAMVFLAVGIITTIVGAVIFIKRDIATT